MVKSFRPRRHGVLLLAERQCETGMDQKPLHIRDYLAVFDTLSSPGASGALQASCMQFIGGDGYDVQSKE